MNGRDDGGGHFVLESENIRQVTLEPVRPDVRARNRVDQLPCDTNLSQCFANGPLKYISHAKPATDFLDVNGLTFEGETGVARDHK